MLFKYCFMFLNIFSNKIKYFPFLFFIFTINFSLGQNIVINEIMSENDNIITDEDNDFSDWIELYNPTNENINLLNWSLSDEDDELDKWLFPNIEIEAGNYLLIYASGKNKTGNELHTNFKIKSEGEEIFLVNPQEEIVDFIPSIYIPSNLSYGRKEDGSLNFFHFENPSPNTSNNDNIPFNILSETLSFSHEAGWYADDFHLNIQSSASTTDNIYYSTDGSVPDLQSNLLQENIIIKYKENTTPQISNISTSPEFWELPQGNIFKINTIRAASFSNGIRNSPIYSKSYLIHSNKNERYPLDIISLITDNQNLFNTDSGIQVFGNGDINIPLSGNYHQSGKSWERDVHFEYFNKEGNLVINQDAGIRIHGFFSRNLPQKSMRIYARNEYGNNYFNYPFFKQKPEISKYKRIIIRSINPNYFHVPFKDELCHLLVREMGLAYQAFEPTVVFINGEYWGIFNFKERHDEYYISSNYNIPKGDVNLLEKEGQAISGEPFPYWELTAFADNNDLAINENYEELKNIMDIPNFINFLIAEMYFELWDFPEQNLKYWTSPDTKFQWLFNDGDTSMHEYWKSKLIKILFPENTDLDDLFLTRLVQRLLENKNFKQDFYSQFIFHLQHSLSPQNVIHKIDSLQTIYDPVMPEHIRRWGYPNTMNDYHAAVNHLREFAALRPATLIHDLRNLFGQPFIISPNPVQSDLQIDLFGELKNEKIVYIINGATGQFYEEGILNQQTMNWRKMNPGVYFLSLNINGIWYTEKVIKK